MTKSRAGEENISLEHPVISDSKKEKKEGRKKGEDKIHNSEIAVSRTEREPSGQSWNH